MSRRTADQLKQTLASLMPTVNIHSIPASLLELATTLLLQSQSKAARLKPEEEPARAYVVCEIACNRLKTRLDLPKIVSRPPCAPRSYKKLYHFLDRTLVAPELVQKGAASESRNIGRVVTPSKPKTRSAAATPASASRTGKSILTSSKAAIDPALVKEVLTPSRKRKAQDVPPIADPASESKRTRKTRVAVQSHDSDEAEFVDAVETLAELDKHPDLHQDQEEDASEENDEDLAGAAEPATRAGLGSLMENQFDYLSDERRAHYKRWAAKMFRRIEAIERDQGILSVAG